MELWEPEGALMEPATKSHAHVAYWEEREAMGLWARLSPVWVKAFAALCTRHSVMAIPWTVNGL